MRVYVFGDNEKRINFTAETRKEIERVDFLLAKFEVKDFEKSESMEQDVVIFDIRGTEKQVKQLLYGYHGDMKLRMLKSDVFDSLG